MVCDGPNPAKVLWVDFDDRTIPGNYHLLFFVMDSEGGFRKTDSTDDTFFHLPFHLSAG